MNKKLRREEGFTLIELLIVIIILGILAAIVIFGVSTFKGDATAKACSSDKKSVEIAAQASLAKNGTNPAAQSSNSGSLVTDGYLKAWPSSSVYSISWTGSTVTSTLAGC
ncbi:MAG: prepilin-type N-terminal cleavage/methylation domain-containing protein [Actinomycetota bacterium]